jgi:hypothetical protein
VKTIRQLCTATLLTLVISLTAFAGEMQTPSATNPPTQETCTTCNNLADQLPSQLMSDADTFREMTLTLMVSMLSIF